MRKLILNSDLAPGDLTMLSAAVRDLHRCHPGQFETDVRTKFPDLWENNPHLTPIADDDPAAELIECHYPLMAKANRLPVHFLEGYMQFLNEKLGTSIRPRAFRGDIHLSEAETLQPSLAQEILGGDVPYWIIDAGGKFDFTIKWWSHERWQEVVNMLRGEVLFVQVGHQLHFHPRLEGVLDLRGMTSLRQLIHLVHHAEGILCPVTALMHFAAAVPRPKSRDALRPCVVVAGSREPVQWESYPGHRFLHRIGALPCCASGACWRSRTIPIGDGTEFDNPEHLCVNVEEGLPKCMAMITPAEVAGAIRDYVHGGMARPLTQRQAGLSKVVGSFSHGTAVDLTRLTKFTARLALEWQLKKLPEYPGGFGSRGIVLCAAGWPYVVSAWVCITRLRKLGCTLPIEVWFWNKGDWPESYSDLFREFSIEPVNFQDRVKNANIQHPWALKVFAMLYSRFEEIVYLDADQIPLIDPACYFQDEMYRATGALFWPDQNRWPADNPMWALTGVPWKDEPEFQGGEAVLDKRRVWKALSLARWFNEHHDFYYRFMLGDKDSYRLAFRKLGQAYAMPATPLVDLGGVYLQHDFQGRPSHQHRIVPKWRLDGPNPPPPGFRKHDECIEALTELSRRAQQLGIRASEDAGVARP